MRDSPLLTLLMAVHTAIVAVSVAAIAYLLWRGLTGVEPSDVWLWAALVWPGAIGLGRYANGVECVLQTWARRLRGVEKGVWARDVLWLPESWARAIPKTFTGPYLFGAGLVIGRVLA